MTTLPRAPETRPGGRVLLPAAASFPFSCPCCHHGFLSQHPPPVPCCWGCCSRSWCQGRALMLRSDGWRRGMPVPPASCSESQREASSQGSACGTGQSVLSAPWVIAARHGPSVPRGSPDLPPQVCCFLGVLLSGPGGSKPSPIGSCLPCSRSCRGNWLRRLLASRPLLCNPSLLTREGELAKGGQADFWGLASPRLINPVCIHCLALLPERGQRVGLSVAGAC